MKRTRQSKWEKLRESRALRLFHEAAAGVPAYRDFLKKRRVVPGKVKTWEDFTTVPVMNKKNYLRVYPLERLCWGGTLKKPLVFTATSGSTGQPVYFPRQASLDEQYADILEQFLRASSSPGPTLVIVCFGMGVWIGGLITYRAFEIAVKRLQAPVSLITPGINKSEIFSALRLLAPCYREVILAGYPPFIKDVVDEAKDQGVDLKRTAVRFLFAAEAFTESLRDYLTKQTGLKNQYADCLNIYGSADIGAMASETTVSILVKRLANRDARLFQSLFGPLIKTPTLAQFNPRHLNFEARNGELILTGDNAVPLVRYAIGDHGGVFTYAELRSRLKQAGYILPMELKKAGIGKVAEYPFVYVYERNDFSVTLYGLQVYPESIREVLTREPFVRQLTGKLTLLVKFNRQQNQYLEVNIEVRRNRRVTRVFKRKVLEAVSANLRRRNSEFRELSAHLNRRSLLALVFWPAEDPLHFESGIKQKWIKK